MKVLPAETTVMRKQKILILRSLRVPSHRKPICAFSPVQEALKLKVGEGGLGPSSQRGACFCMNGDAHIKIFIISGVYLSLLQPCDKQPSSSLGEPPSNTHDRCAQFVQWSLNRVQSGTHLWYIRTRLRDLF